MVDASTNSSSVQICPATPICMARVILEVEGVKAGAEALGYGAESPKAVDIALPDRRDGRRWCNMSSIVQTGIELQTVQACGEGQVS